MSVPDHKLRAQRARKLVDGTDAWHDPSEQRLAVIAELLAMAREALLDGYVAEAQGLAHECTVRLGAHLFMAREVEHPRKGLRDEKDPGGHDGCRPDRRGMRR